MLRLYVRDWTATEPQEFYIKGRFNTITEIKSSIRGITEIENDDQLLIHEDEFLMYDDNSYNIADIADDSHIDLYPKLQPQTVYIKMEWKGKSYNFEFQSEEAVIWVKKKIDKEGGGVSPHRQVLRYMGVVMDNYSPLSDYFIKRDNEISLEEIPLNLQNRTTVTLDFEGIGQRVFELEKDDTLYTLLAMVREAGLVDNRKCDFWSGGVRYTKDTLLRHFRVPGLQDLQLNYRQE